MNEIQPLISVRSMLFAPAVRPEVLARLAGRGADTVVIDCEDATPPSAKAQARRHAFHFGSEAAASMQPAIAISVWWPAWRRLSAWPMPVRFSRTRA